MRKAAIAVALFGVLFFLFEHKTNAQPLAFSIDLDNVRLSAGRITADFSAHNGSTVSTTVTSLSASLYVNNILLGPLQGFVPFTIAPGDMDKRFSVEIPAGIGNVLAGLADLISGGTGSPAVFRAKGIVAADLRAIPLDATLQIV